MTPNPYNSWLLRQSDEYLIDLLGADMAKFVRSGKVILPRFMNRRGDALTIAQARQRDFEQFGFPLPENNQKDETTTNDGEKEGGSHCGGDSEDRCGMASGHASGQDDASETEDDTPAI